MLTYVVRQLTAVCFVFIFLNSASAGEKILTIGVSGTYSGGFAAVGKRVSDGEADYLKRLASEGGIAYKDPKTGKTEKVGLNVIVEDNQYNAVKAVYVYESFKTQRVNAVIGFGSTPGQACAENASKDKVPYLSWYAYATAEGYKAKPQYYWTGMASVTESATPLIKWCIARKQQEKTVPRVGMMVADVPSWRAIGKPGLMAAYVRKVGGELAGIEFFPLVTTDLTQMLATLIFEKGADAIVLMGATSHTVILAKNLQQMQIDPAKTAIVCNISAWGDSLFDSVPRAAEGICGEVHTVLPDENTAGIEKVKALAKWAGRDTETLTTNYIYGMIGSFILETAIRRALEKHGYEKVVQSGDAIRDEIHNFKAADPFGLSKPPEVLYPDRPYLMNYSQIVEAKDGKFVKTGDWILIDRIEGAM